MVEWQGRVVPETEFVDVDQMLYKDEDLLVADPFDLDDLNREPIASVRIFHVDHTGYRLRAGDKAKGVVKNFHVARELTKEKDPWKRRKKIHVTLTDLQRVYSWNRILKHEEHGEDDDHDFVLAMVLFCGSNRISAKNIPVRSGVVEHAYIASTNNICPVRQFLLPNDSMLEWQANVGEHVSHYIARMERVIGHSMSASEIEKAARRAIDKMPHFASSSFSGESISPSNAKWVSIRGIGGRTGFSTASSTTAKPNTAGRGEPDSSTEDNCNWT
jgi:hypothetical protein